MSAIPGTLEREIASLPPTDETRAALDFLRALGTIATAGTGGPPNYQPVSYWLGLYRPRRSNMAASGITTVGFDSLLSALERLPSSEALRIAVFEAPDRIGVFWLDCTERLVGFLLIEKPRTASGEADGGKRPEQLKATNDG